MGPRGILYYSTFTYFKGCEIREGAKHIPWQFDDIVAREDQHFRLLGQVLEYGRVLESFVRAVDHVLQAIVVIYFAATAFALELGTTIAGQQ